MNYKGKFRIEAKDSRTGDVREVAPEQSNIFLDKFFSISEAAVNFRYIYCVFGTGSTTPQRTDTTLASIVSGSVRNNADFLRDASVSKYWASQNVWRYQIELALEGTQGAIQGNISELGLSTYFDDRNLFTRALIKDAQGNPTTVTLGEFDVVTVYYTIAYEIDVTNPIIATKTYDFGGVSTTATLRWFGYRNTDPYPGSMWETLLNYSPSGPNFNVFKDFGRYMQPYSGTVVDFEDNTQNPGVTSLDGGGNVVFRGYENGTQFYSKNGGNVKYPGGTATGNWSGIAVGKNANALNTSSYSPTAIITFDPPINKTETTTIDFSNMSFFTGAQ